MSQVNINLNTNQVEINTTNNQIVVNDPTNPTTVNITQPITNVVEVITAGPQGPPGPPGSGSLINTGSFITTSSLLVATVEQINVGETNNGEYAYVIRAQELEESKHTTINIYNNLNFI